MGQTNIAFTRIITRRDITHLHRLRRGHLPNYKGLFERPGKSEKAAVPTVEPKDVPPVVLKAEREPKVEVTQPADEDAKILNGRLLDIVTFKGTGGIDAIATLIDGGADVNCTNKGSLTPLILAARVGRVRVVELLLDLGAEIDKADEKGMTALMNASFGGHRETVELLLSRGADASKEDDNGNVAISFARFVPGSGVDDAINSHLAKTAEPVETTDDFEEIEEESAAPEPTAAVSKPPPPPVVSRAEKPTKPEIPTKVGVPPPPPKAKEPDETESEKAEESEPEKPKAPAIPPKPPAPVAVRHLSEDDEGIELFDGSCMFTLPGEEESERLVMGGEDSDEAESLPEPVPSSKRVSKPPPGAVPVVELRKVKKKGIPSTPPAPAPEVIDEAEEQAEEEPKTPAELPKALSEPVVKVALDVPGEVTELSGLLTLPDTDDSDAPIHPPKPKTMPPPPPTEVKAEGSERSDTPTKVGVPPPPPKRESTVPAAEPEVAEEAPEAAEEPEIPVEPVYTHVVEGEVEEDLADMLAVASPGSAESEVALSVSVEDEAEAQQQLLNEQLLERASEGTFEEIIELVEEGADVNAKDDISEETSLMIVSSRGMSDAVQYLLGKRADITAVDARGWDALIHSVSSSDLDTVIMLLDNGANPDYKPEAKPGEKPGLSAFAKAKGAREEDIALIIQEAMSEPESEAKFTPLMLAVEEEDAEAVNTLLSKGADVDEIDTLGQTALIYAVKGGNFEIIQALLAAGANPFIKAQDRVNALTEAAKAEDPRILDAVSERIRELSPSPTETTKSVELRIYKGTSVKTVTIPEPEDIIIGQDGSCNITVEGDYMLPQHGAISYFDGELFVTAMDAVEGAVYVNEIPADVGVVRDIKESHRLLKEFRDRWTVGEEKLASGHAILMGTTIIIVTKLDGNQFTEPDDENIANFLNAIVPAIHDDGHEEAEIAKQVQAKKLGSEPELVDLSSSFGGPEKGADLEAAGIATKPSAPPDVASKREVPGSGLNARIEVPGEDLRNQPEAVADSLVVLVNGERKHTASTVPEECITASASARKKDRNLNGAAELQAQLNEMERRRVEEDEPKGTITPKSELDAELARNGAQPDEGEEGKKPTPKSYLSWNVDESGELDIPSDKPTEVGVPIQPMTFAEAVSKVDEAVALREIGESVEDALNRALVRPTVEQFRSGDKPGESGELVEGPLPSPEAKEEVQVPKKTKLGIPAKLPPPKEPFNIPSPADVGGMSANDHEASVKRGSKPPAEAEEDGPKPLIVERGSRLGTAIQNALERPTLQHKMPAPGSKTLAPLPDWSDVEVPQEPEPDIDEVIKKATTPTPAPPPPESVEVELEVSDGETTAQGLIDIEPSLLSGDAAGDVSESFDLSGDVEEEAGPELVSTRDAIAPPPMEKTESGTDAAESDEIEIGDEGIELDFGDEEESGAPEPKVVIEATTSREDDTTPEQIVLIPEDEIEQELDDNDEDVVEVTDRDELAECLDEEDQSLLVSEPPEIPIKRAMLIVEQPGMGVEYLELVEDGTRSVNLTTSKVTNRSLTLGFKNGKLMLTGAGGDFSLEVRVNDERALLRGDRKLRDGDVLHLRGGSLRVSLGLKGGKPGGGAIKGVPIILAESSFLSPAPKLGLQMMEKQITDLPGSSEVALECWTSKMCSELGKLRRLEGDERSKAQTRIMRSMGYLVAKACSSGTPDVFFKFIEKTENVADLAALLQAFEKSESLTEVKLDASVLGEIQSNLKVDRERNFYEQMWALVQAMPGDMLLPIKHSQFIKDLKQITDTPEGRREILATLNPLMNPLGVAAWEDDGKLNIAQVNHMIEDEGVNYVFVHEIGASNGQPIRTGDAKLAEFDSLAVDRYMVSDEYGRAPHKDMDRLIIIRGNRNFRSGQFAHQHRLQSFLNIVSGYDASISTNGRPEEAKVLSETVSMAAALYYSGFDDDSITRMLEQFSQAKDGMNGDEMLSARRLLGFMNTNLELSPIAALRLYLDSEYSAALGVGLMDLRGIKRSELNVGKKKTILGVVDKLVERARKTLAPKE